MKQNIFLEIEYLGTSYFGFQVQNKKDKHEVTVQEVIEKSLHKLFKEKIRIIYAGRTDRGVHAKAQTVNFITDTIIPLSNIKKALNAFLPADIRVKKVKKVPLDFHSRFSAKSKVYRYIIFQGRDPSVFQNDFSWHIPEPLNIEKMKKAANILKGKRDCAIFAKEAKKYKDCVRDIIGISVKKRGNYAHVDLKANGFLRNMARNIVSFLVKVGDKTLTLKDASQVIKGKAVYTNKPAPANGLYLLKVNY